MAKSLTSRLGSFRRSFGHLVVALLLTLFVYALLWLLRWFFFRQSPLSGLLGFLFLFTLSYLTVSGIAWVRRNLLWSLRNQIAAAYVVIAIVPLLLLLAMAGLGAYLLYWQLGSYLLYTDMQARVQRISAVAGGLASSFAIESTATGRPASTLPVPNQSQGFLEAAKADLPGLKIEVGSGQSLLALAGPEGATDFKGIVLSDGVLALRAVAVRPTSTGKVVVSASAPVTSQLLETLSPELGPVHFMVIRPVSGGSVPGEVVTLNGQRVTLEQRIIAEHRSEPPPANLFDKRVSGITTLDVVDLENQTGKGRAQLNASFVTRPSLLNRRLFGPLGDLGSAALTLLLGVGVVFLVLEFAALATGVVLTRAITTSVDSLYLATQHAQSGDLSFRVRVQRRDQLGALGESFNSMMRSVGTLIEEQRQRHRLENELSIAREVQTQLFPHELPSVPGVELAAICRPARMVSGDYYDFIRIGPTRLAIALADISGKGISAALLMASLQAALHSELLREGHFSPGEETLPPNTSEIVAHLNRHLYLSTSDERYATLFFAVYDTETRQLSYTNAGHLPPFYIVGDRIQKLETDDTVIGLFNEVQFGQASVEVEPGGLLVIYSDGLIEPENVSGDAFGADRLAGAVMRCRESSPQVIADAMLSAAEKWSGSSEQADDMTVIVARLSRPLQETRARDVSATPRAREAQRLTTKQ